MCELGCFPIFLEKDLSKVDKILVNAYRQARTKYTLIYDTCLLLMGVNLFTTEKADLSYLHLGSLTRHSIIKARSTSMLDERLSHTRKEVLRFVIRVNC